MRYKRVQSDGGTLVFYYKIIYVFRVYFDIVEGQCEFERIIFQIYAKLSLYIETDN